MEWNFPFTVPVEEDGWCHQDAQQRLVAAIVASPPFDVKF
jgi:hypothetical protein